VITYLKVRNLAIVEEFAIEPGPGLNVLTGETGAGKSLLIDSLEFLRGGRSSGEMIRTGTDRMSAEAVFALPSSLRRQMDELGVEFEAGGGEIELIVKREISTNGRGRVLLNGSPLSVRDLGTAMDAVLEIHGQHESHDRIAGQGFRELLDDYAGHHEQLERTHAAYEEWRNTAGKLQELTDAQRDRALRLDLLKYQIDEIAAARLDPTEEESLRSERSMLAHAREMLDATSGAFNLLDEDENSALTQLGRASHLVQPLSNQITEMREVAEGLNEVTYRLQDLARTLARLTDTVRLDPDRLNEVEDRLVTIDRLKKKYGGSVESVLEHFSRISEEHEQLSDFESSLEKLQNAENRVYETYRAAAGKLSDGRRKASRLFQTAIEAELHDLAMERTKVRIDVGVSPDRESRMTAGDQRIAFGPFGFDRVEILIAPNAGDEPRPMQRIASGGELSRIQLAIAAALFKRSKRGAAATLIFDEIDAGIGGRVAEVVGRKLQELAVSNQVLCVTHLPQIARFGETHFYVWKEDEKGQTRGRIRRLDDREERVSEIARMLGGETIPATAITHARELLGSARTKTAKART
jgi:DNA repair protein RecN (Recombination protein N)